MKGKWSLISSIIQVALGVLVIISFIILAMTGENMARWIVTLLLAIAFVVIGIMRIIDYKSNK